MAKSFPQNKFSKSSDGLSIGEILLQAQGQNSQQCNIKLQVEDKPFQQTILKKAQEEKLREKQLRKFANQLKAKAKIFQAEKRKLAKSKRLEAKKLLKETCENEAHNLTVLFCASNGQLLSATNPSNSFDVVEMSESGIITSSVKKEERKN